MLEFLLEQGTRDRWVFRRHPVISRPLDQVGATTVDGVGFVRPEVALLFKAKAPRFKDQRDFDRVLPRLDRAARSWLASGLAQAYPGRLAETAARPSSSWWMIEAMDEPVPSRRCSQGSGPCPVEIVAYDPAWPDWFAELGRELRAGLGEVALRIDHIGSTAVPGLAAKPIIDIQISVADFEPLAAYRQPLEQLGYVYRADNPERTKRYFREPPGRRRTHVHVRRAGSFSEQWALLFRDYLRAHPDAAVEYVAVKRRLALRYRDDRRAYTDAKGPFLWEVIRRADEWAQAQGWQPGPTDA